jgi:hypothetical protein
LPFFLAIFRYLSLLPSGQSIAESSEIVL